MLDSIIKECLKAKGLGSVFLIKDKNFKNINNVINCKEKELKDADFLMTLETKSNVIDIFNDRTTECKTLLQIRVYDKSSVMLDSLNEVIVINKDFKTIAKSIEK